MVNFIPLDLAAIAAGELPPVPIGALTVGLADLMGEATGLPQPGYITVSSDQRFCFQFTPDRSGARAVTRWAMHFGGVLTSEPREDRGTRYTLCELRFDYYGVRVAAYALIPAATAT